MKCFQHMSKFSPRHVFQRLQPVFPSCDEVISQCPFHGLDRVVLLVDERRVVVLDVVVEHLADDSLIEDGGLVLRHVGADEPDEDVLAEELKKAYGK